jgi:hypothetical protein
MLQIYVIFDYNCHSLDGTEKRFVKACYFFVVIKKRPTEALLMAYKKSMVCKTL